MTTDKSRHIIKAKDYNNVVNQFTSLHNNQSFSIANSLNLKINYVNFILDFYIRELELKMENNNSYQGSRL